MKNIHVALLADIGKNSDIKKVSEALDKLPKEKADITPWAAFAYKPAVSFTIAHADDCILLKYYVKEKDIQAKYTKFNEPVYKDSCVEFFLAFDEGGYYNFEFNCIGNALAAYGASKQEREFLPESLLQRIKYHAVVRKTSGLTDAEWELTLLIPVDVLSVHALSSLKGQTAKGNFYKCGDELPQPHYVSWTKIETVSPDFHRPEYFGELVFEK